MAGESRGSCRVNIGGVAYDRMLSMTLRRNKNEATCEGTIVLSWPGAEQFTAGGPVASAFTPCMDGTIELDGQLAATIMLDKRISKGTPKHYELTIQFRGKASKYIDTSPDLETGQADDKTPAMIGRWLGVNDLEDRSGGGDPLKKFIYGEGESIERALRRAAREHGLHFWEVPEGHWRLEKKNQASGGGQPLIIGKNFTQWSTSQDASPRYTKLQLFGNTIPTDNKYGKEAESLFSNEERQMGGAASCERLLRQLVDSDHSKQSLENKGEYDGDRRAGQGASVTMRMSTWSDDGGRLWACGNKHHVSIPVDQIDDEMEIIEVIFELTPDSRSATLTLNAAEVFGGGGSAGTGRSSVMFDQRKQPKAADPISDQYTPPPPEPTPGEIAPEIAEQPEQPQDLAVQEDLAPPGWTSRPSTTLPWPTR